MLLRVKKASGKFGPLRVPTSAHLLRVGRNANCPASFSSLTNAKRAQVSSCTDLLIGPPAGSLVSLDFYFIRPLHLDRVELIEQTRALARVECQHSHLNVTHLLPASQRPLMCCDVDSGDGAERKPRDTKRFTADIWIYHNTRSTNLEFESFVPQLSQASDE